MNEKTYKTMVATAELLGASLSEGALLVMTGDLERYSDDHLMIAFKRMRQDGTRFNTAEIIKRLPAMWPGAEQAWAQFPRNEEDSACVCQEMLAAWGIASGLDEISGRMAFKEAYNRAVSQAMSEGKQPNWIITTGSDKQHREQITLDAVRDCLISPKAAQVHLPHIPTDDLLKLSTQQVTVNNLIENHAQTVKSLDQLMLAAPADADAEIAKAHLRDIKELLGAA
ncbi:hypothetical protein [uncultured Paraglaciecola sp.]|mgnify:CR=1 FL=1|uniref:hypothetical protein n=1 Tax=uncultured Paraglaciecola sp. TaxID=1765024 RepID=UPI00263240C9|nr:hypothetical protein [uncultured Paraglaciecola sp.]